MKIYDFLEYKSKSIDRALIREDHHSPRLEGWRKFFEFLTGWFSLAP